MKPEDYSKAKNDRFQSTDNKKPIDRREALNKAGWYALSAATMMVLMKSQPAKAASALPAMPNPPSTSGQEWRRTTRT
jgi:spore coat protein CotF